MTFQRGLVSSAMLLAVGIPATPVAADFENIAGTMHIYSSVDSGSPYVLFDLYEAVPGLLSNAVGGDTGVYWDVSTQTSTSGSLITGNGNTNGDAYTPFGFNVTCFAQVSITFNITAPMPVLWSYWESFNIDAGFPAGGYTPTPSVNLVGPGGTYGEGMHVLPPGQYTITAFTGFVNWPLSEGPDGFAHVDTAYEFELTTNVPAPGMGAGLLMAAVAACGRRRRR